MLATAAVGEGQADYGARAVVSRMPQLDLRFPLHGFDFSGLKALLLLLSLILFQPQAVAHYV